MTASEFRPTKVCSAAHPECPRCEGVIRRVHTSLGSTYARCENRPKDGSPGALRGERTCGQHVHILGCPEGVCVVTPISREEFKKYTSSSYTLARRFYGAVGVLLRSRDADPLSIIPEHDCANCHASTLLYDLYGSICRWCRDNVQRPPNVNGSGP
jgi:hypothetical protein